MPIASVTVSELRPVLKVTLAYVGLWYVFLYMQAGQALLLANRKDKDGKVMKLAQLKYGSALEKGKSMVRFDRTVGNTLEQMMPFLVGLWLHALFVSVEDAAFWGWLYLLSRSLYPWLFPYGVPAILISTIAGYAVIIILLYPVFVETMKST